MSKEIISIAMKGRLLSNVYRQRWNPVEGEKNRYLYYYGTLYFPITRLHM